MRGHKIQYALPTSLCVPDASTGVLEYAFYRYDEIGDNTECFGGLWIESNMTTKEAIERILAVYSAATNLTLDDVKVLAQRVFTAPSSKGSIWPLIGDQPPEAATSTRSPPD